MLCGGDAAAAEQQRVASSRGYPRGCWTCTSRSWRCSWTPGPFLRAEAVGGISLSMVFRLYDALRGRCGSRRSLPAAATATTRASAPAGRHDCPHRRRRAELPDAELLVVRPCTARAQLERPRAAASDDDVTHHRHVQMHRPQPPAGDQKVSRSFQDV